MKYQVELENYRKSNKSVIIVKFLNHNCSWILTDFNTYPIQKWLELLENMNSNTKYSIVGGADSYWSLTNQNNIFTLDFIYFYIRFHILFILDF